MPEPDPSIPENPSPTPGSGTAQPSTPEGEDTAGGTTDDTTAGETGPRSGEVTADETKRFLSEFVAARGLAKVGDAIATAVEQVPAGGILITSDLAWAASDIYYLELRQKLTMLTTWTKKIAEDCQKFLEPPQASETQTTSPGELLAELPDWLQGLAPPAPAPSEAGVKEFGLVGAALAGLSAGGTALAAQAVGITAGLKAVGDIIGYFRADYEIKGQTLADVEDLYIQALVADKLLAKKKEVYLLNFNFIERSPLIDALGVLLEQKYQMLSDAEKIKSRFVDGVEAQVQALEAHLASLRAKLVEYLVKVDEDIVQTLELEIGKVTAQLEAAQGLRTPETQITALETYLSSLRTKLVEELVKDPPAAKAQVEEEIAKIVKQLGEKDDPEKKLSEVQVKELNDRLKLLQEKLVGLVPGISDQIKSTLKEEIKRTTDLLKVWQSTRLPDSQITALEAHLASLRAKLVECLLRNDEEARKSLVTEIQLTVQGVQASLQKMREANGIVNNTKKVNDAVDAFITTITTIPTGGTYPPLVTASIRQHLTGDKIRYILKIKLMSSGADFITEKPPFYSRGARTSYMGGGVVSYVLAEKEGRIVASGTSADIAALEHRLGKEPELLDWKVRRVRNSTPTKPLSLIDLLVASSLLYMVLALVGAAIALGENRPAAPGGLSTGLPALRDFLYGNGTALSPPLYMLIIQVILTYLALRSARWRTLGVIGLTVLGLLFGMGMLAEPILREIFGSETITFVKALVGAGLVLVPFMMMVLGLLHWNNKSRE
jgi:hypothetical protein